MTEEIRIEAIEYLERDILFGFESKEEIFESIREMFYNEVNFDDKWLKNEIERQFSIHLKNSTNWKRPTDFEKLVKVFDQLNKEKIVSLHNAGYTRQDAEGDCRDIIEELGTNKLKAKGFCYYHSQDLERAIDENGVLFIGYDSNNPDDKIAYEIANRIVELLRENGFQTEWNNSVDSRIKVKNIDWKKVYDNIDYNYNRVFSIFENHNFSNMEREVKKPFWKFW